MGRVALKRENKRKKKHIMPRLLFYAAIVAIIGLNIYTIRIEDLTDTKMPFLGGYGASIILSDSMEPELSVNDIAFIKRTHDVSMGDIIVYQLGPNLIIHRVVSRKGDTVWTKGDAVDMIDAPIDISDVLGKMIFSVSIGGKIISVLKNPTVIVVLLIVAFILFEHSFYVEKKLEEKRD
jgi:signal peptidase I